MSAYGFLTAAEAAECRRVLGVRLSDEPVVRRIESARDSVPAEEYAALVVACLATGAPAGDLPATRGRVVTDDCRMTVHRRMRGIVRGARETEVSRALQSHEVDGLLAGVR